MKTLKVTLQLELSVPDDWTLAQTSDGGQVLQLPDGRYLDLTVEPLYASDPEETWRSTDDEAELNDFLDMVQGEDVQYEFKPH